MKKLGIASRDHHARVPEGSYFRSARDLYRIERVEEDGTILLEDCRNGDIESLHVTAFLARGLKKVDPEPCER